MRLHVACSTDRRYVRHAATMLLSSVRASPELEVRIELLHGGDLNPRTLSQLTRMIEDAGAAIRFHAVLPSQVGDLPLHGRWTPAIWYRILLPQLLPGIDRVLYLDADTLIVSSLAPLATTDLFGHHVAAVTNVLERHWRHRPADLGLEREADYFNSGVLLFNLEQMRADDSAAALRAYARAHNDLLWPDQDALNAVFGRTRLPLHPRWNRMNSFRFPWSDELLGARARVEALADPAILHFEGPRENKPWHLLSLPEDRERYRALRRGTPWPRYRPAGLTPVNVGRRLRQTLMASRPV